MIVDKSQGKFKELKTIGVGSNEEEIEELYIKGREWIAKYSGKRDIFKIYEQEREEEQVTEHLLSNIKNILLNGFQLLLNRLYDLVGFNEIEDEVLKHLVTAGLGQPMSRAATVEYLKSYFAQDIELHKIYRDLDKLHGTQQDKVQQISVAHTQRILGGKIGLLFFNVTPLYFEADRGDGFRELGFSKDGKHSQP